MARWILTYSPFTDPQGVKCDGCTEENGPVFNGDVTAGDALARYRRAGAADAKLHKLTAEEYIAIARARLPQQKG